MLIRNYHAQRWLLALSSLSFIGLVWAVFSHDALLSVLDNLTAQLQLTMLPNWLHYFLSFIFFFSHSWGSCLVIFLLAFFLWGFKFKIPAFWLMTTSIISGILLHIVDFILPVTNFNHAMQFPAFGIFWATLIYTFVASFVGPEIQSIWRRSTLHLVMLMMWCLVFLANLFQPDVQFSGVIAGWLFAIIVLELFEHFYVQYAPTLAKMNGFYGSWY